MSEDAKTPVEVELKLDVEPDDLSRILAHPVLCSQADSHLETQHLHSTYFDTPDHDLKQAGISLRIRSDGEKQIQTIKASQAQTGVALARGEWEREVADGKLDFEGADETALKPFLKMRDAIRPLFSLSVERDVRELAYGRSLIEVAADRGRIERLSQTFVFAELELELKEGDPADLFALALVLAQAAPLRLSFRTKAERGFESISGVSPQKIKAEDIKLKRRFTSAVAFQVIGGACLRHLMANEAIVRQSPSPDAVHQMRVALRRLRAAITLFKLADDEQREGVKSELKWMASALGEARDLDVYIANVLGPAVAGHAGDARFKSFLAEIEEQRNRAYDKALKDVASPRFINGTLAAAAWIQAGPWAQSDAKAARKSRDRPVSRLAAAELGRRWKRVLKRGRHLVDLEPEERHQVRIEIKKLRYAAEFFDNLFKRGKAKKRKQHAIKTLAALQDALGELNDIVVGSHMHESEAAELIQQEQLRHVDGLLSMATDHYRDLAGIKPFWNA